MGQAIVYYIVKGQKLDWNEWEKLNPKPKLPQVGSQNFKKLKDWVEYNTDENKVSEIIVDTDNDQIILALNK